MIRLFLVLPGKHGVGRWGGEVDPSSMSSKSVDI